MYQRRRAVIVGVNGSRYVPGLPWLQWAEADAQRLYEVLTHEITGTFDPADVTLLRGAQADTGTIKRALRTCALQTAADDFMLVAFAGHALVPSLGRDDDAYLVSHDLDLDALRLQPDLGVRTTFLRGDVIEETEGSTLLILDCCQAGRFVEKHRARADRRPARAILDDAVLSGATRHSALLSCPADRAAREADSLRNGVFTHHLLRGLEGDAAGANGEVNLDNLAGFLGGIGLEPPVGRFVQTWREAVTLTRPGMSTTSDDRGLKVPIPVTLVPLRHPLEGLEEVLQPLLGGLLPPNEATVPTDRALRLNRVRAATGSEAVGVVQLQDGGFDELQWDRSSPGPAVTALLAEIAGRDTHDRRKVLGHVATSDNGTVVVCVRLNHDSTVPTEALALVNPSASVLKLGEPLALMLQHYLVREQPFGTGSRDTEIALLTALRREFGRLPHAVYEHAFGLYSSRMRELSMVFEPVVALNRNPDMLGVHSWEALARGSSDSHSAPGRLLDAVETWGSRFYIERDLRLAEKAIETYAAAHAKSTYRGDAPKPVGINVAVRALLSPAYLDGLTDALSRSHLPRGAVTLEISEKDPIVPPPTELWLEDPILHFREHLARVSAKLHVNFAVDDFGVGHASLDRIATLTLAQIKIDPAILQHELALDELRLVVRVAEDGLRRGGYQSRPIVMEGVERESLVPLNDIYMTGIQYVQGYIVDDMASSELKPLDRRVRERIASQLTGASV